MITLSERTRIAVDRLSADNRERFSVIVKVIDASRAPRPEDSKLAQSEAWVARLDANLRIIYHLSATGVFVEDVVDRARYPT